MTTVAMLAALAVAAVVIVAGHRPFEAANAGTESAMVRRNVTSMHERAAVTATHLRRHRRHQQAALQRVAAMAVLAVLFRRLLWQCQLRQCAWAHVYPSPPRAEFSHRLGTWTTLSLLLRATASHR